VVLLLVEEAQKVLKELSALKVSLE